MAQICCSICGEKFVHDVQIKNHNCNGKIIINLREELGVSKDFLKEIEWAAGRQFDDDMDFGHRTCFWCSQGNHKGHKANCKFGKFLDGLK